jgi:serine/threonine-protein kinase
MPRAPNLAGCALDHRYELYEVLGEGAFGRVYRGRDRRLGREVAVKVIKPWWAEDGAWVERFEREARLLARVSDPGVVQIFDVGHAEEGPYYVAELVHGESLADRLRDGPLAPEQARLIAEQLCRALASAHRDGVVHCDIKPANVLLSVDGKVKVGDFGVARLAAGTSQAPSATAAGTPRYMSPEQARGRPTTPATDVYSAGVVLYEMLAGRPPFTGGSPVELGLRHLQDPPPPLPDGVSPRLRAVVERALAKDPAERYADGQAMAEALHQARRSGARRAAARRSRPARNGGAALTPDPALADTTATSADTAATRVDTAAGALVAEREATDTAATATRRELSTAGTCLLPRAGEPPLPRRMRRSRAHERRHVLAALAALIVLAGAAIAALVLTGQRARTTVPELRRLPRGGVQARARRLHVQPAFSSRYSDVAAGIAIAQHPAAGTRVLDGSTVQVMLSAGPPPVPVPGVVGQSAESAESALANAGLRSRATAVAAPGSNPNVVVRQSPAPPAMPRRGSTVALSVSETPRWRALTSFSGVDDGKSVPFRILGSRWRVSYSMAFRGTCLLLFICEGPSAEAVDLHGGSGSGSFELSEGESQTHVFTSGPGLYRLAVSGGRDSARWSITVDDYY